MELITEILGFDQGDSYKRSKGGVAQIKRGTGRDKKWFIVSMTDGTNVMVAISAVRKILVAYTEK